MDRRRGLPVSGEGWAWIAAAFAAVAVIATAWPILAALYDVHVALAMTVAVAQAGALLLAVRVPWAGIVLATLAPASAVLLSTGAENGLPWPWPVPLLIAHAVLVLLIALRHPWPWAVAAWALPQLAVLVSAAPSVAARTALDDLYVSLAVSAGVATIGVTLRLLIRNRRALRAERLEKTELSIERQELAERNRIAQELHDVVAHSMSVISVQATTAKYRLEGVSDEAAAEFESIAESSRQALGEMRGLLATLRARDGEAPLVPQPGIADIPELIETTRRSGASIDFASDISPGEVPPATGLTVYRIVQEALSNAVRHAPGAAISVSLGSNEGEVIAEVLNDPAEVATGGTGSPGAGLGLSGIRDRAAALGGAVEAAPTPDGGFRVRATLPHSAG
jgi:signal transduction histidine kinase